MNYLADDEISTYCTTIPGVTKIHVSIATELIDSYISKQIFSKQITEIAKLSRNSRNGNLRGKLKVTPIISVDSIQAFRQTKEFGVVKEDVPVADLWIDYDDGYYTYVPSTSMNYLIFGNEPSALSITYTVGYKEVPEKIKLVCAMLAQTIKQKSSFAGEKEISSLDYRVAMTDDSFFTSDMRLLLSEYRFAKS